VDHGNAHANHGYRSWKVVDLEVNVAGVVLLKGEIEETSHSSKAAECSAFWHTPNYLYDFLYSKTLVT
jgi:hypothetical protein